MNLVVGWLGGWVVRCLCGYMGGWVGGLVEGWVDGVGGWAGRRWGVYVYGCLMVVWFGGVCVVVCVCLCGVVG
jgi:hypothetical protein